MEIQYAGKIITVGQARLVENDREMAWAERAIRTNDAFAWLIGNYVEADRANGNRQFWTLEDLEAAHSTVRNSPLNLAHVPNRVLGTFVDSELMYPTEDAASDLRPVVEVVAAMWKWYFPREHDAIAKAHKDGSLFFSMESVAQSITCHGPDGCGQTFDYAGAKSRDYCSCLNDGPGVKKLNKPHFLAGAVIIPPDRPGWSNAEVTELSREVREMQEIAYESLKVEAPHLGPREWEAVMNLVVDQARTFTADERRKLAEKHQAMPDGSYPIANAEDLRNAIRAIGRAKPGDRSKVIAHIKRRAAALGMTQLIPENWK